MSPQRRLMLVVASSVSICLVAALASLVEKVHDVIQYLRFSFEL